MKSILLAHARKYPLMEPTDAVKLIYQNEFGGGHLISDADACLNFLHREYRATPQNPVAPLTEDIGNGIVRVNLAALDAHNLSPEELGHSFIRSASLHKGSMDSFLNKLSILTELTQAGHMPFSSSALETYLSEVLRLTNFDYSNSLGIYPRVCFSSSFFSFFFKKFILRPF